MSVDKIGPLGARPILRVRLGGAPKIAVRAELPKIAVERVRDACNSLALGKQAYRSLLYLSRATSDDIPTLFEASCSPQPQERWQRLWVLCPILTRLARSSPGLRQIRSAFENDMAALQVLAKFADVDAGAVERFFKRTHDDVLDLLLRRLLEYRRDERRRQALVLLIAVVETSAAVLRSALAATAPEYADDLLPLLTIAAEPSTRLSSGRLRERLLALDPKPVSARANHER